MSLPTESNLHEREPPFPKALLRANSTTSANRAPSMTTASSSRTSHSSNSKSSDISALRDVHSFDTSRTAATQASAENSSVPKRPSLEPRSAKVSRSRENELLDIASFLKENAPITPPTPATGAEAIKQTVQSKLMKRVFKDRSNRTRSPTATKLVKPTKFVVATDAKNTKHDNPTPNIQKRVRIASRESLIGEPIPLKSGPRVLRKTPSKQNVRSLAGQPGPNTEPSTSGSRSPVRQPHTRHPSLGRLHGSPDISSFISMLEEEATSKQPSINLSHTKIGDSVHPAMRPHTAPGNSIVQNDKNRLYTSRTADAGPTTRNLQSQDGSKSSTLSRSLRTFIPAATTKTTSVSNNTMAPIYPAPKIPLPSVPENVSLASNFSNLCAGQPALTPAQEIFARGRARPMSRKPNRTSINGDCTAQGTDHVPEQKSNEETEILSEENKDEVLVLTNLTDIDPLNFPNEDEKNHQTGGVQNLPETNLDDALGPQKEAHVSPGSSRLDRIKAKKLKHLRDSRRAKPESGEAWESFQNNEHHCSPQQVSELHPLISREERQFSTKRTSDVFQSNAEDPKLEVAPLRFSPKHHPGIEKPLVEPRSYRDLRYSGSNSSYTQSPSKSNPSRNSQDTPETPCSSTQPSLLPSAEIGEFGPTGLGRNTVSLGRQEHIDWAPCSGEMATASPQYSTPAKKSFSNRSSASVTVSGSSPTKKPRRGSKDSNSMSKLVSRVTHLERENKLLEAALMAVLKTGGALNRCSCHYNVQDFASETVSSTIAGGKLTSTPSSAMNNSEYESDALALYMSTRKKNGEAKRASLASM